MDGLKGFRQLMTEEDGMGTVEIILIIVVLVGLVILFKGQITKVVEDIFKKITIKKPCICCSTRLCYFDERLNFII